jgi:hypothetical protein
VRWSLVVALLPPIVIWLGKHMADLVVTGSHTPIERADMWPTIAPFGIVRGPERALGTVRFHQQGVFLVASSTAR